ncbi:LysR family transcriptional regulator [Cupriavidus pauculus]|uniref:LysR family transcriptional regulator n=1 Tax=Cupriavidus pauculus TaxID=82633 RepID=UPI001EE3143D|nr:LysR family transcriptional regulator [Cupriavidus pauculus]GJG93103.1 LysR family transcriptional regulator [Cupriavidus pauculus]
MDKFHAMQVFTRVVDTDSFSRAADTLGMPRGSVTRVIQELEAYLRVRLLNRTTRSLSVTSEGAAYYEKCVRILADVDAAEAEFAAITRAPRGRLRVDMSGSLGKFIVVPALNDFHARYPDIDLTLGFGDRLVDLVQEGIDCVIRIGELDDSTMVARRLGVFQLLTAASPAYLARHGTPMTLDSLRDHLAVNFVSTRTGRVVNLNFSVDGKVVNVHANSRLSANDGDAHLQCGVMGLGLIQVSRVIAQPFLDAGTLVEVLPAYRPAPLPISVVYPQNRHLSPQVRAFVDWTAELFARCPSVQTSDGNATGNAKGGKARIQHSANPVESIAA